MSIETLTIALHHSRSKGTTKLVLLGICNHDGDGGAWPSIRTLARYAACSESQASRAVGQLVALGEIRRHVNRGGTADLPDWRRPNRYDVLLECPSDCDRTKHHRTVRSSAVALPAFTDSDSADRAQSYPQSYPQPPAPMRGGSTHAGGSPRTHAGLTVPRTNNSIPVNKPQTARARDLGDCGHRTIAPEHRHCVVGCPPQKVRTS